MNEFKASAPRLNPDGWGVFVGRDEDRDFPVDVYAICATVGP